MQIKIGGSGQLAAILARMGSVSFSGVVDSVGTNPLSGDLFSPPAGYKLKAKKYQTDPAKLFVLREEGINYGPCLLGEITDNG